MGKHAKTRLDIARDELFSHIRRCQALQGSKEEKAEWLDDTMDYIAERYPRLTELELAQVEVMGQRYLKPPIPHGKGATARNRESWQPELAAV